MIITFNIIIKNTQIENYNIKVMKMGIMDIFWGGKSNEEFNIGDKVRVKYRGQEGYIIDKNDNLYMVSLDDGRYIDSYSADQLEKC